MDSQDVEITKITIIYQFKTTKENYQPLNEYKM